VRYRKRRPHYIASNEATRVTHFIEDFVEATNACPDRDGLFRLYRDAVAALGYDRAIYTFVTDHDSAGRKAGHGLHGNYPEDWMRRYADCGYLAVDPVILSVRRLPGVFLWENMERDVGLTASQRKILCEAGEAGLRNGIGVPLHGPHGELAGVGLAGEDGVAGKDRRASSVLRLLSYQFHGAYCAFSAAPQIPKAPVLTGRELEVLKWWAVGKTVHEIGVILNCSARTAKWHIGNVYAKLDANSKILAVTKAVRLGMLPVDLVKA
jgi:DNA-binding CsgD family transcriptional regulator